jgi:hypothetical protein
MAARQLYALSAVSHICEEDDVMEVRYNCCILILCEDMFVVVVDGCAASECAERSQPYLRRR